MTTHMVGLNNQFQYGASHNSRSGWSNFKETKSGLTLVRLESPFHSCFAFFFLVLILLWIRNFINNKLKKVEAAKLETRK